MEMQRSVCRGFYEKSHVTSKLLSLDGGVFEIIHALGKGLWAENCVENRSGTPKSRVALRIE